MLAHLKNECILFTPKYFWKHLAITESHKWDKHRKSVDVQERAASETKTEGYRRISSWGGRMSGGCGGCHLSACWGQEWSLTDGFRDSNALSCPQGCQTHQIINAITTIFIIVLGCAVRASTHFAGNGQYFHDLAWWLIMAIICI